MNEEQLNKEAEFIGQLDPAKIRQLDVRPILGTGKDPFSDIMAKVEELNSDEILLLINSFEPVPLYSVLGKKGFNHVTQKEEDVFKIYFYRNAKPESNGDNDAETNYAGSNQVDFENIIELDVRGLEPPEPMVKILETLPKIDEKTLLLVHHHREPLMLYPKLEERGYTAQANKIQENYYKVLISKKKS